MKSFNEYVEKYELIIAEEAQKLIDEKEEVIIFVGKSTCPFCNKFIPKLDFVINELEKNIYFINSYNNNESLENFRNKYNIKTVPGLLVSKNSNVNVVCDSSLSIDEIKEFILK